MISIRRMVFSILSPLFIILIFSSLAFSVYQADKFINEMQKKELITLSDGYAEVVYFFIEGKKESVLLTSYTKIFIDLLKADKTDKDYPDKLRIVDERMKNIKDIGQKGGKYFELIDAQGIVIASGNKSQIGTDESILLGNSREGIFVQATFDPASSIKDKIKIVTPIVPEGILLGASAMIVNREELDNILLPDHSSLNRLILIDSKNQLISASDLINVSAFELEQYRELIKDCFFVEKDSHFHGTYEFNYNKIERIGVYSPIPNLDWCLIVETNKSNYSSLLGPYFVVSLFFAAILLTLGLIFGFIFVNRISKPINVLNNQLEEISKGKLNVQLDESNIVEIQSLTNSINRLLSSVKLALFRLGIKKEELGLGKYFGKKIDEFIDFSGDIFIALNYEGKIKAISKNGAALMGYKQNELIEKNWFDIAISKNQRAAVKEVFTRIMQGELKNVKDYENDIVTKTGKLIRVRWENSILKDELENIIGTMSIGFDIHGEQEAKNLFKLLYDHSRDGILVAEIKTKNFIMGNNAICRMLGYTEAQLKKLTVKDIHPKKDLPKVLIEFQKQITGEKMMASNLPILRKDGHVFYADVLASPVTIAGKECLMGSFRFVKYKQ